ncbi:hypothetical protein AWI15_17605 [Enterobacter hormaechei subsp. xiangfangensis]|nr:hypothetical protein AWI15_17605 [Enterobacter hormaechei subsp. xiangfangensis]KUQ63736.1 hypothetical protein AWI19_07060 [Enterobacter hormaechei subsp. xiangfangensis]
MASISLLDSLPDHFRLLWCTIAHRVEQRQRWLAFVQVIPDSPWRDALIGLAHIAVQRDR